MNWCHVGWHWVLDHGVTHTSFHVEIDNFFAFFAVLLLLTMYIYVKVLLFVCHHMPLLGPLIIIKFKFKFSKQVRSCCNGQLPSLHYSWAGF